MPMAGSPAAAGYPAVFLFYPVHTFTHQSCPCPCSGTRRLLNSPTPYMLLQRRQVHRTLKLMEQRAFCSFPICT